MEMGRIHSLGLGPGSISWISHFSAGFKPLASLVPASLSSRELGEGVVISGSAIFLWE